MKLKYYLRGLSVGIICTAIIMGIALSGSKKERLTDAEIIERARILGMVMEEENEPEDSKKIEDNTIEDSKETDNKKGQLPKVDKQEQTVPKEQETETKEIEILPGEYSDVVSQKLFDAGLITDAEAFNKYLMDSGKDQYIMVGVHKIPAGANQDEIIKILGEKPQ